MDWPGSFLLLCRNWSRASMSCGWSSMAASPSGRARWRSWRGMRGSWPPRWSGSPRPSPRPRGTRVGSSWSTTSTLRDSGSSSTQWVPRCLPDMSWRGAGFREKKPRLGDTWAVELQAWVKLIKMGSHPIPSETQCSLHTTQVSVWLSLIYRRPNSQADSVEQGHNNMVIYTSFVTKRRKVFSFERGRLSIRFAKSCWLQANGLCQTKAEWKWYVNKRGSES